jgi:hypothetical protein
VENEALVVPAGGRRPDINPETQHFMAKRMGAKTRSCSVDHTPPVTAPDLVVDVILEAVAATTN